MFKKALAAVISGVVALSLCPGLAFASPLETAELASDAQLATQAKTTVYVIESATYSNSYSSSTQQFKYNPSGLVKQAIAQDSWGGTVTYDVSYKNGNISKIKKTDANGYTSDTIYNYSFTNKKGKITQVVMSYDGGKNTTKYTYKNGKVATKTSISDTSSKLNYKYEKGKLKKIVSASSSTVMSQYGYDKKGNVNTIREGLIDYKSSLTYKNGKLEKRVTTQSNNSTTSTITYKYKKLSLSKSAAKKAKAQQFSLRNNNINQAFGPVSIGATF
jgi:hypothetical protein